MVSFDTVSVPPPAEQPEGKGEGEGEGEGEAVPAPPVLATETAVSCHVVPPSTSPSTAPNTALCFNRGIGSKF